MIVSKITNNKMVKNPPISMFNTLYNFFAEKLGEDVSLLILNITGCVKIEFKDQYWEHLDIKNKIKTLIYKYNYQHNKINELRLRNYIFRKNIKFYYIYDAMIKNNQVYLPIGRVYEKRPIVKKDKKIKMLSFTTFRENIFITIDYFNSNFIGQKSYNLTKL